MAGGTGIIMTSARPDCFGGSGKIAEHPSLRRIPGQGGSLAVCQIRRQPFHGPGLEALPHDPIAAQVVEGVLEDGSSASPPCLRRQQIHRIVIRVTGLVGRSEDDRRAKGRHNVPQPGCGRRQFLVQTLVGEGRKEKGWRARMTAPHRLGLAAARGGINFRIAISRSEATPI